MTYEEARDKMAGWLERHADASLNRPEEGFDEMDGLVPRVPESRWKKVFIALNFWDGWLDASNHDWQYYEPICELDWPVLARTVAEDLRADREVTSPLVLALFDRKP